MTYPKPFTDVDNNRHSGVFPECDAFEQPARHPDTDEDPLNIRLGQQLRDARESRQLDLEDCGQTLRLPVRVLKKLEAGDYAGISESVYLRDYLMSYGACVGLSDKILRDATDCLAPAEKKPALVSTGGIPHSHYLWHRYTTVAAAIVLTAVVVVPLVWLGLKGGLDRELTRLQPLDSSPVARQETSAFDVSGTQGQMAAASGKQSPSRIAKGQVMPKKPLMASMAPFSALHSIDQDMSSQDATPPSITVPGSHTLAITLTQPCWVEVSTAKGKRLEYSLLPAGTHKVYHSAKPLNVSLGNTAGAKVRIDGKAVDLDAYRHANVAHFHIALEDGQAVAQVMRPE